MPARGIDPLRVPEDFWEREPVRSALRARDVKTLFQLLQTQAGASQTQIGAAVGLEQGYVSKVVNSRRTVTAIDVLERIAAGCNMPDRSRMLLGLAPGGRPWRECIDGGGVVGEDLADPGPRVMTVPPASVDPAGAPEWPVWFGVRLAYLVGMVDNWRGGSQSDVLQTHLHQEMLMFDAASPTPQPAHTLSRRQALATLAALPLTYATVGTATRSSAAATESFLSRCAASLTACWHMLKGRDLLTIDQIISAYIFELEALAKQPSPHQEAAARLASQAHRICGIIALHRNQLGMREQHCRRALSYAVASGDAGGRVSALISLASTYFYDADPTRAAVVYEQALSLSDSSSPLQQSRIHAELSVVYAQLAREQDTLRAADLAERLYPEYPEQDRSYLFAEFTRASLTLERGLSYMALAERCPSKNYQRIAADIFARVEQAPTASVPERIRYEIINHQAKTAVLRNDLEGFETYLARGIDGAVALGSTQRRKEALAAWRVAAERWPNERRLMAIGERVRPMIEAGAASNPTPRRSR